MRLNLRKETPEDRAMVATMLARTYGAEGVRAIELVGELRQQPDFDADLALVVERDGVPLASAILAPVKILEEGDTVVLASLAFDPKQPEVEPVAILDEILARVEKLEKKFVLMRGNAADFETQGFQKADDVTFTNSTDPDWLVKGLNGHQVTKGNVTLPAVLLK